MTAAAPPPPPTAEEEEEEEEEEEDDDGAPNPFRPPIAEGLFFLLSLLVVFDLAMPSADAAAAVDVVLVDVGDVDVGDATGETASPSLGGGARRQHRDGDNNGDDDGGRKDRTALSGDPMTTRRVTRRTPPARGWKRSNFMVFD
jgi:hypothetical protein